MRGHAPRASLRSLLPPKFGGLLGEDLSVEVRIGRPHEAHRRSRSAPTQNTNVQKATRPPHSGGQRRRRGGLVLATCTTCNKKPTKLGGQQRAQRGAGGMPSHSATPTQRAKRQPHNKPNPWAKNLAPNAKSAPLPNTKCEVQGGRGRARARAAGGAKPPP